MPFTSGKQAFLEILKQEGVELMFGNPGTTELPLMDGLAREPKIRYILALQESVAIAMAHPTGPVFISLPVDVLNAERELDLLAPTRIGARTRGDRAQVDAAAEML